jgi:ATP-dependent exoDNAse (exonuclease V) beta subunit
VRLYVFIQFLFFRYLLLANMDKSSDSQPAELAVTNIESNGNDKTGPNTEKESPPSETKKASPPEPQKQTATTPLEEQKPSDSVVAESKPNNEGNKKEEVVRELSVGQALAETFEHLLNEQQERARIAEALLGGCLDKVCTYPEVRVYLILANLIR